MAGRRVGPTRLAAVSVVMVLFAGGASAQVGAAALAGCIERGFSTEEDFETLGPTPPDGSPLISDGDLFSEQCVICARNADLLAVFGIADDLGLDASDVVPLRGV